jgi:NADPH-dependent curcumin reductase CurA
MVLAARPQGRPAAEHFRLEEAPVPEPGPGQMLCRTIYLSLDPYMRGRMNDAPSYTKPVEVGEVMVGGIVGRVVRSNLQGFAPGDFAVGYGGWQDYAVFGAGEAQKVDPSIAPISTALGVLGMPGFTAWYGLLRLGEPKDGETVFVSAAAGAVGSAAGQLAGLHGCRVVGSAGSEEKLAWLRELGFDATFSYRDRPVRESLREAAPDGIDIYFDNVGGDHLEAAIGALRTYGRVVACGAISRYNDPEPAPGPRNLFMLFTKRLTVRGFIITDHYDRYPEFLAEVGPLVRDGRLRYRETVVDGIENAPRAFIGLLQGENVGKMLVRVGPSPDDR